MKTRQLARISAVVAGLVTGLGASAAPIGTAFTYQGRLEDAGGTITDTCDFNFRLWDQLADGIEQGTSPDPHNGVSVADGLFTVTLDFGADAFPGEARFLEIEVCCTSPCAPGGLALLAPRQELTPAPHAIRAVNGVGGPDALNVDSADRVGIGAGALPPTEKLDVAGNIKASGTIQSGSSIIIDGTGGAIYSTGNLDLQAGGTSRVYLDNTTGNVGIGMTSPGHKLEVTHATAGESAIFAENTDLWDDTPAIHGKRADGVREYGIGVKGEGGYKGVEGIVERSGAWEGYGVRGWAGGTNTGRSYGVLGEAHGAGTNYGVWGTASGGTTNWAGYFDGRGYFSGNVGIGTTPSYKLDVNGNIHASGTIQSGSSITIDGTADTINSTGNLDLKTGGTSRVYLNNSTGNVGIGTTSPNKKLVVDSGGNSIAGWFRGPSGATSLYIGSAESSGDLIAIRSDATNNRGNIRLWGDTEANGITIESGGNVGIGTTSPSYRLDVRTSSESRAIYGENRKSSGVNYGVYGRAEAEGGSQIGVYGEGEIHSTSSYNGFGVKGVADCSQSAGSVIDGYGGHFTANADDIAYGVYALASSDTDTAYGVYATTGGGPTRWAGYFSGNVHVTGDLSASGTKPFKIDHPLDPENKYLYHYALESPEVLNLYRGTVVLDAGGEGWAELPTYFQSINRDFTYQLTAIGAAMPNLHVAQEIDAARFKIAGGKAGMKVSWQVTGVRNDPYVREYGAPVEVEKPETERGFYQHPELYGQPEERGVDYRHRVDEEERHLETAHRLEEAGPDSLNDERDDEERPADMREGVESVRRQLLEAARRTRGEEE